MTLLCLRQTITKLYSSDITYKMCTSTFFLIRTAPLHTDKYIYIISSFIIQYVYFLWLMLNFTSYKHEPKIVYFLKTNYDTKNARFYNELRQYYIYLGRPHHYQVHKLTLDNKNHKTSVFYYIRLLYSVSEGSEIGYHYFLLAWFEHVGYVW